MDKKEQELIRYCTYHETVHYDKGHESGVCRIVLRRPSHG